MVRRLRLALQQILTIVVGQFSAGLCLAVMGIAVGQDAVSQTPAASEAERPVVSIRPEALLRGKATESFVITHGCGGTKPGDRFHRLAAAIVVQFPTADVLIIDWSEPASAKIRGLPNPWRVARSIDSVADQAAELLTESGLQPARTTLIGESFGNWVNARIARRLGGARRILAFNPASEAGGYAAPDLRQCAKQSWSFHTYSAFDTSREIADADFFLETSSNATDWQQHVAGIAWLTERLLAADKSWLLMEKQLPARCEGVFQAKATMDGWLEAEQLPRQPPLPEQEESPTARTITQ